MLNKVMLIGNLGRDPELRSLQNGKGVCSFSLATSESYQDRSGEKQTQTEWHNVVVFGPMAEACAKYLGKGSKVYVEGKIQTRSYEARDGSGQRSKTEIIAQRVQFLDSRQREGGGPSDYDDEDIPN